MTNIRELAEADLEHTLEDAESGFGLPIELTSPAGIRDEVNGQILYEAIATNPETGEPIMVKQAIATVRRSSLLRIPVEGEDWHVRIPIAPSRTATKQDFLFTPTKAPMGSESIGFLKMYLQQAEQSA